MNALDGPLANWNGVEQPLAEVRVSVLDRAFLFGDAVYEVLRVYGGQPFLAAEHLARLRRSLSEVRISADVDRLEQRMHETLRHSGVTEGFLYIQVTRGAAPRTRAFPNPPVPPNELIYVQPFDRQETTALRQRGARLLTVEDLRWKRCDIKSVNLLANCLASQAAQEAGCDECLLISGDGTITEGSSTSVFGVRDGRVLTPPLKENILPGITRGLVLTIAGQAGIGVQEGTLRRDELDSIDEMFLTGTTVELLPVASVDNQPIGNGRPGAVTQRLYETYQQYVRSWLGN